VPSILKGISVPDGMQKLRLNRLQVRVPVGAIHNRVEFRMQRHLMPTPASVVLSIPDVKMPLPDATTRRSGM
jgi:hypothetical protein